MEPIADSRQLRADINKDSPEVDSGTSRALKSKSAARRLSMSGEGGSIWKQVIQ